MAMFSMCFSKMLKNLKKALKNIKIALKMHIFLCFSIEITK